MFKTFGPNLSKKVRLLRVPFLDTKWKLHHYIDGLGYIEYVGVWNIVFILEGTE